MVDMSEQIDDGRMSRADYARRIGVTRQRVHQLEAMGRVVLIGGAVDVAQSDAMLAGDTDPRVKHSAARLAGSAEVASMTAARTREVEARALRAELLAGQLTGDLVLVSDVEREARDQGARLRSLAEGLPDRVCYELAMVSDAEEVRRRLAKEIHHMLVAFASRGGDVGG
jgi:hypothetical protein